MRINKRHILINISIALFCLFLVCTITNYDYDLFARLIVGERIVDAGIFPYKDFLSYTPTHDWYDHEWGSSVIFYIILKYLKPIGLILFQAFIMFMTIVFVLKTQKLQNHAYPVSITFAAVFAAIYNYLSHNIIRCHIFTFLFFSVFLFILENFRLNKNVKLIWFIPPIILIWNNLHGGVVAGYGLIFMYLIGSVIEKKTWKNLFAVILISFPLLLINPYGYKYLNFLFNAVTMHRKYIIEWWPFYHEMLISKYWFPALFCILGYGLSFLNMKKFNVTKIIVLSVTLFEGLYHVKLMPLALISVCALCYNDFYKPLSGLSKYLRKIEKAVSVALIIISVVLIPILSPTVPRADWNNFPLQEVEFVKINNLKGNILTYFGHGSYVAYKLYPQNLIYMDGRYEEVYNNNEFLMLGIFELAEKGWENIVYAYGTDIMMVNKYLDIFPVLLKNNEWQMVFEGPRAGVFVKKNKVKKEYKMPSTNLMYYKHNILVPGVKFSEIKVL